VGIRIQVKYKVWQARLYNGCHFSSRFVSFRQKNFKPNQLGTHKHFLQWSLQPSSQSSQTWQGTPIVTSFKNTLEKMGKMQIVSILVFLTLISISSGKIVILQPSLEKRKESDYGLPSSKIQVSISPTFYEQGGNSQNFLRKFLIFFLTSGLKILRL